MKAFNLKKGSIIGVCAPSGAVLEEHKIEMEKTKKFLENYGFKVVYSDNIFSNSLGYSSTVEEKVEDLNKLINNPNIDAIFFARGGNNANSIIPFIDYEGIKKHPKLFIGFSDITIILNAIYKMCNLITYHFTTYKSFYEAIEFNVKQFEKTLITGTEGTVDKNTNWISIKPGVSTGKLIGGNLSVFCNLLYTKYLPDIKNNILFLEDLSLETQIEEISCKLYQLKNAGIFDHINGILVGNYKSLNNFTFEQVLMDVIKEYDFPIIKCDDFGHSESRLVLPIGVNVTLDSNNKKLIFNEKTVNMKK